MAFKNDFIDYTQIDEETARFLAQRGHDVIYFVNMSTPPVRHEAVRVPEGPRSGPRPFHSDTLLKVNDERLKSRGVRPLTKSAAIVETALKLGPAFTRRQLTNATGFGHKASPQISHLLKDGILTAAEE